MTTLSAREAYRLWAPVYEGETAVSQLEDATIAALGISLAGCTLADVGCGTARRIRSCAAAVAVGVDLSFDMLAHAPPLWPLAVGDVRALPLASDAFDVAWFRLAIGHLTEIDSAYAELARICRAAGTVIVSDLNPDAAVAGHRRVFSDAEGLAHEVEHTIHSMADHRHAGARAGLELVAHQVGVVGPAIRHFYDDAGRLAAYEAQLGSPIVIALAWRKRGA